MELMRVRVVSCVEGSVCTDIGGVVGCCPAGETCDWLQECKDFAAEECAGEGAEGCWSVLVVHEG